ncbi:ABC transporter substrate-binding protein [Amylibacter sp. SFDW26]|uniref:ABC transporter substrate-binding protein n=1 Tax=Amylibacter sp. SFDW26 TaxID=2652722 RepID=UPI001261FF38|nr:ABC transporter substrate-binding protein [Amylibacter sp. SFDW26]KAB7616000.1 ABC transporter substrate-binding protein [Amylibacter sp. SFDW26]
MYKFKSLYIAAFLILGATHAQAQILQETLLFEEQVKSNKLPAIHDRIPDNPLIVVLPNKGRTFGVQGGTLRTMVTRSKDTRQMVVYGYSRLVNYNEAYELKADILENFENEDDKKFTLRLRKGHKWSDGAPFTSADFKYWWVDVASNKYLSPSGSPDFLYVDRELPTVSFPDELTIIYEWQNPNPKFLQTLAQARPPFIFRPAHYLKQYHADYADPDFLAKAIVKKKVRSWASLHNKLDNMYKFDNAKLPTLQPWLVDEKSTKNRKLFVRNPYYHRVDGKGVQLPYIDHVDMNVVGSGLVAAKANAGEVDLQARGLSFKDISILKKGEKDGGKYKTFLWANGTASQIAIYPNLNFADRAWREIMRDVRFRRALSLSIDRNMINRVLYFGLAKESSMTALPRSAFYDPQNRKAWSQFDLDLANDLLDEMGLTERRSDGIRLLPDGRPVQMVVETPGERQEVENALSIITDTWREAGVKLVVRPLERDILRNRVYSGTTMAAIWFGWDNGLPQPNTSPSYLAPRQQDFFAWPKWGQHYQMHGKGGYEVDMPEPQKLLKLSLDWDHTSDTETRSQIWQEMLSIHADQQYGIGILSEAPQPVVVSNHLKNVPKDAVWAWDPGAHFGVYRMDEFYFDNVGVVQ